MLEYLKKIDINSGTIDLLKNSLKAEVVENLEVMQDNVLEVLKYLKEYGVTNLEAILLNRPDICFRQKKSLEQDLTTLDKKLLIFVFNNSIDDLINFNI